MVAKFRRWICVNGFWEQKKKENHKRMDVKLSVFVGKMMQMMLIIGIFTVTVQCGIINNLDEESNECKCWKSPKRFRVQWTLFQALIFLVAISDGTSYNGVNVYTQSRECAMLGALCVLASDCEKGELTHKKGLCPDHEIGVECCYKITPRAAPCHQFGGVCMEECTAALRQPLGNDCGDKTCCIQTN